jgi:hypothetical protein
MRLFALALVSFGLNLAACDKKDAPPAEPQAAAATTGDKPAEAKPADPAGNADKPAEAKPADPAAAPAAAAADPAAAAPAAAAPAAAAPAAAPETLGVASCDKYIKNALACIGQAPEANRAAQQQMFDGVVNAWKTQISAQGDAVKPALEQGCAAAYDGAKTSMATMCPGHTWE